MRPIRLGVVCTITLVSVLWAGQAALGAPVPVTTFSATGTAIDLSAPSFSGHAGPCAFALAASATRTSFAGSGSLTASGGTGARRSESTCAGGAASLRFEVVRAHASDSRAVLHVRVTHSDDPTEIGRAGTIMLNEATQAIRVHLGPHRALFEASQGKGKGKDNGKDRTPTVDHQVDVGIADVTALSVTHFTGTGTAVDIDPDLTEVFGDCAIAVSGIRLVPPDPAFGEGGSFTTILGQGEAGRELNTCLGGVAHFSFVVDDLVSDGESLATATLHVAESDLGPAPGVTGSVTIDEANQVLTVVVRRQTAVFGPGRHTVADLVETRAGAGVATHVLATG